jgi:hypothetical protein
MCSAGFGFGIQIDTQTEQTLVLQVPTFFKQGFQLSSIEAHPSHTATVDSTVFDGQTQAANDGAAYANDDRQTQKGEGLIATDIFNALVRTLIESCLRLGVSA